MPDTKIFNHKRYYRYEYHGKKMMPRVEAEEGIKWFRSRFTRLYGKVVATIRKHKESNGMYSLWHRDREYEKKEMR